MRTKNAFISVGACCQAGSLVTAVSRSMPGRTPPTLQRKKDWLKNAEAQDGPDSPFVNSLREQIEKTPLPRDPTQAYLESNFLSAR